MIHSIKPLEKVIYHSLSQKKNTKNLKILKNSNLSPISIYKVSKCSAKETRNAMLINVARGYLLFKRFNCENKKTVYDLNLTYAYKLSKIPPDMVEKLV